MPKTAYKTMLECDGISRRKINDYVEEHWDVDRKTAKSKFDDLLQEMENKGHVRKENRSYVLTRKFERYYAENYTLTDEETDEDESPKAKNKAKTKSKK
ncbi:hypothetical protein JCM8097_002366 [Rhodosporidiobolus ruineniae]